MAPKKNTSKTKETPNKQGGTSTMPLFYSKPTPLDAKSHGKLSLKKDIGLSFTKEVNAVPINLIEMPQICHFYPIAFSNDGNATPVAILGIRDNENLYVSDKGEWEKDVYIPAYIRRYPFIFSEIPNSDKLTLCMDVTDSTTSKDNSQPLFDKDGAPTQLANNALEFCKSYHSAAQQTIEFSKALEASNLLVDRQAEITVADNKKITFSGFKVIDEKKLAELKDKDFLEWRSKGWLPFLYAHLFSGMNWQRLTKLVSNRITAEAA